MSLLVVAEATRDLPTAATEVETPLETTAARRLARRVVAVPLFALFAFALVLRVWGLGDMEGHIGDEGHMVPAAQNFVERGHFRPDPWVHPPVAYFVVYGMMNLWGDNEYGWRMGNVLIGSLAVLFLVLLAQELFSDPRIAGLGGLFMTIEPFQITLSRTIPGEIPALFFFIVACYITVRYAKGKVRSPVAAGIFLGLSLASKWYYLLLVPVLILLAWQNERKAERWIKALHVLSVFVVLPAGIYLLTYYPWFGRGHGVPDFVAMQVDIYREQQALTLDGLANRLTPGQAQEVHHAIRRQLVGLASQTMADRVRIVYGGSVKADNIDALMAEPDIDGALVGGASLDATSFARIVQYR